MVLTKYSNAFSNLSGAKCFPLLSKLIAGKRELISNDEE